MRTFGGIIDNAPDTSPLYAILGISQKGSYLTSLLISFTLKTSFPSFLTLTEELATIFGT